MASRVARKPIELPKGVEVSFNDKNIHVKGSKGALDLKIHDAVNVDLNDNLLTFTPVESMDNSDALSGTMRAIVNNMVTGVSQGYEIKLILIGVGYRAQVSGKVLNLTLGFSHPVNFPIPEGITIETPSQTEVVVKGVDKQLVGETAAKIRRYRPPEPYKGKGIRYHDENVQRKETKKK
ncbi:MAG: 50S ribosomal protein L6 [Legionellales bacterium]|nr:50S ribosomal protein L6 [Legionellales bacterium]|tara:strand:- start:1072 stop:1608 length:537 start_codon:yes stop_codon:yes gene_type:complete